MREVQSRSVRLVLAEARMKLELRADQNALVEQVRQGAELMAVGMNGDLDATTAHLINIVRAVEQAFREIQASKARRGRG